MIENLSDKKYYPSEVTYEQDLNYIMNKSIYACTFKPSKGISLLYGESQEYLKDKFEEGNKRAHMREIGLVFIGCLIIAVILGVFGKNWSEGFSIFITFVMLGLVSLVTMLLKPTNEKPITLKIDNFSCNHYQLRMLSDDKLCIICGANFNEDNKTMDENFISEVEPTYSDLIVLEEVESIEEIEQGVIIHATTIIRRYEPDKAYNKYTEMDEHINMDIFIQKGVYPENLLTTIADEV